MIQLESEVGAGSTFTVFLPRAAPLRRRSGAVTLADGPLR
jgi:hypothetical protein